MRSRPRHWRLAALLVFLPLLQPLATAAQPKLADRILAVVDEDPVLASDVERAIGLGLAERQPGEDDRALRRRVLDELIEQRLRFHEVDRYGFTEVPVSEIEARFAEIRGRFASPAAFRARLAELGMDEDGVRNLVARQLMVLTYVEERLGVRVFVGLDEIRSYHESTLVPEMRRQGKAAPPLEEVRESIRAVLKEQRLNEELERWTEELRRQADVIDHFDSVHEQLPAIRYQVGKS
jgi:hypothetical protein